VSAGAVQSAQCVVRTAPVRAKTSGTRSGGSPQPTRPRWLGGFVHIGRTARQHQSRREEAPGTQPGIRSGGEKDPDAGALELRSALRARLAFVRTCVVSHLTRAD